jgi:hypothetical protein
MCGLRRREGVEIERLKRYFREEKDAIRFVENV